MQFYAFDRKKKKNRAFPEVTGCKSFDVEPLRMHHYQNISCLLDALNRKRLTVDLLLFFHADLTQLISIIIKLENYEDITQLFKHRGR